MEHRNNKRNILSAFLVLLFCFMTLVTASYAWFTENRSATLDNITINVVSKGGIQISTNAETWHSNVSNEDIINGYPGDRNKLPQTLTAISSGGIITQTGNKKGLMEMFEGSVNDGGIVGNYLTAVVNDEYTYGICSNANYLNQIACEGAGATWNADPSNGDFIAFDLFINSTMATGLYLLPEANVVAADTDIGLKNASRVAFIIEGNGPEDTALSTLRAFNNGTAPIIWEPNNNSHTASGITNGRNHYGFTEANLNTNTVIGSYQGVIAVINPADNQLLNSTNPNFFRTVSPDISTAVTHNGAYITNIESGVTKIRIYAWIEGQDIDCENDASGSSVTYTIGISTRNPNP